MRYRTTYFHCAANLRTTLAAEIRQVQKAISAVPWSPSFIYRQRAKEHSNQAGYNRALARQFLDLGWEGEPNLRANPKLIADFRKGTVFVEIQFGNSAALYRDYYKFQYGYGEGLLSLAVLIVPQVPTDFFPARNVGSIRNMADAGLARNCLQVLPIGVPTLLIGLLPRN